MSDSAYPTDEELPPLSPSSTRSSRSEHRSTASSTRLGLPVHSRGASASTTTRRSDDSSFGDTRDQPRPPASTASTASSSSSTSTSFGRPALPPPPAPLPAAYSHPAIPPTPRRKPLPAPPATSPRFVPLHAPLPPPPSTTSPSAKGKGRQIEYVMTAAEEKAAARARAQGLDELLPLSSPAARARKGVDESDDGALASPASPTGTDLPDYPASPARGCLRRSGTTAKRVVERDGEELCATEDKRALAEAEVRAHVNGEARRTVEEDATASKAALARRAQQEEREREEGEGRRREREVEKRRAALPHEDDEQDDDDELPPPISPNMHGRGMLPLVDHKELAANDDARTATPPPPPSSTASYRLPPPPIPLREPAYPLSSRPDHRPGRPAAADYFSQPVPPRPSFPSTHSAPLPTRHARPDLERYSTMSSSSRSQLYPGAVASSTSSERSFPLAHGPVRPAGARHVSLGPAHSFYSSGVAQVTLKSLEDERQLAARAARSSTSTSTVSLLHELNDVTARHSCCPSYSTSSETTPVSSWSTQARLPQPQPYLARSTMASSSMSTRGADDVHGVALSSWLRAPSAPLSSSSREWHQRVTAPPSPSPPAAPHPWAQPSTSHGPARSPAFYTSIHPGGPLLPFYAAPSTSPGQPPSSYFSPAGAQGFPPPPAPPLFASLALAQPRCAQAPSPGGGAAYPLPGAPTSYAAPPAASSAGSPAPGSPRASPAPAHSQATSPRPWSRSSSSAAASSSAHSPPPGGERGAGAGVREKRMSTIRSLFGRRRGGADAGAGELAGMPEEEDEAVRMGGQGWR